MVKWRVYEYRGGYGGGLMFIKEHKSFYGEGRADYVLLGIFNIGDLAKLDKDEDGLMDFSYFE